MTIPLPYQPWPKRTVLTRSQGVLVGTLDHPIFVDGTWVEAADAHDQGLLAGKCVGEEVVKYGRKYVGEEVGEEVGQRVRMRTSGLFLHARVAFLF